MPAFIRWLLNVFLYAVYVVFFSVAFSVVFPLVLQALGQPVWEVNDPRFAQIQIFLALLVLLVTLMFRRFFYIQGSKKQTVSAS